MHRLTCMTPKTVADLRELMKPVSEYVTPLDTILREKAALVVVMLIMLANWRQIPWLGPSHHIR
jgi:hypothetical protein